MRKLVSVFLAAGLLSGAAGATMAQDLAVAVPAPKAASAFVVFTEKGDAALSPTALATVRSAADKARDGRVITLAGSPRDMLTVRDELIRQGVSASAIVARNDDGAPLPKAADGLSDPAARHVQITL